MKIAYVSISHKPICQTSTGGIETFSIYLLNALAKAGISIDLYATDTTDMSALPGVALRKAFTFDDLGKEEGENTESKQFVLTYAMFQYAGLAKALQNKGYDVVHFSSAQWYIPFLLGGTIPTVTTVHVQNLKPQALSYVTREFPGCTVANISDFSARPFMEYPKRRTIYNGIDISQITYNKNTEDYVAWLGRIAPVKGLKEAVVASKMADVRFVASGPIDFVEYYKTQVEPLLDEKRSVRGPLHSHEKNTFLGKAKAVLMPVQWDEPFGLVAVEALAAGTPVIAFKRGGLTEIVEEGVSGFLVDTVEQMAEAISRIGTIDRVKCRERAEKLFSSEIMAKQYISLYGDIIKR